MTDTKDYLEEVVDTNKKLIETNNELLEIIRRQASIIDDFHNSKVAGLNFDPDTIEYMETIFPGGILATPDQAFTPIFHRAIRNMAILADMRYVTSVSGAMRWPWSQEAGIKSKYNEIDYA